ncbi:MAG: helix-turn-helix domain-containing protein [Deltaproteobacteria bacterium]|nr:helix-turn-helix domain-containing protein [Deltaproteobacteria bacterium]
MEEILTPLQVAELLKIHVKTVYKLAKEGTLTGCRIGRSWRFEKRQLMQLLSASESFSGAKNDDRAASDRAVSK